eukprot:scaffold1981_cov345-Pinguiococcus_pyrenoidosus.AAC.2
MGGDDALMEDLTYLVLAKDTNEAIVEIARGDEDASLDVKKRAVLPSAVGRRMLPQFVIRIARWVNPF